MLKRSTPIKRSPLVRKAPDKATLTVKPRKAKCKHCGATFERFDMRKTWCSPECGAQLALKALEKARQKAKAAEKREDTAKRQAMKPLGELRAEAQSAFNAFIRERDKQAGHGCICCGKPLDWWSDIPGGKVDAGHFMSRGSSPALAFDERNVSAQRKACNRPGGTTRDSFRAGMVARWGAAVVEELEGPHAPKQYRADEFRRIKAEYTAKLKALKAEHKTPSHNSGAQLGACIL